MSRKPLTAADMAMRAFQAMVAERHASDIQAAHTAALKEYARAADRHMSEAAMAYRDPEQIRMEAEERRLNESFESSIRHRRFLEEQASEGRQAFIDDLAAAVRKSDTPPSMPPEPNEKPKREREINRWLRETWETEGCPTGGPFFVAIKKHKDSKGSPITAWHAAGKGAGIEYRTSAGAGGSMTRKTIQTKVSEWRAAAKKPVNSKTQQNSLDFPR